MIKLFVIVVGLFGIIPTEGGRPTAALLVRVDRPFLTQGGEHIPLHEAAVFFRPFGYRSDQRAVWFFDGETLTFGTGSPTSVDPTRFAEMNRILDRQANPVKLAAGCNSDNHSALCRIDGFPALVGRVVFQGGQLSPLNVRSRDVEDGGIVVSQGPFDIHEFRTLPFPGQRSPYIKAVPTGLLYSIDVAPDQAVIVLGSETVKLDEALSDKCQELGARPLERCAIVTILNSALKEPETSRGTGGVQTLRSSPDPHFDIFYRLLAETISTRFLPARRMRPTEEDSDPPESRCIPPVIVQ